MSNDWLIDWPRCSLIAMFFSAYVLGCDVCLATEHGKQPTTLQGKMTKNTIDNLQIRSGTELFVDDVNVARAENVKRTLHQARKLAKPVLEPDRAWEKGRIYIYGTAVHDLQSGKFRMWYSGGGLAYAESEDGVHWRKPELPYVEIDGQKTNILVKGRNLCFVIDDAIELDPARRFKALDNTGLNHFVGMYSADGFLWKLYDKQPLIAHGSEISSGVRNPRTGEYFVYMRPYLPRPFPKGENEKRLVSVITSKDFLNWSEPNLIIRPDAIDDAWVKHEPQRTEFYGMSGFAYGNHFLGLLPVFRVTGIHDRESLAKGQSQYEGPIQAELVTSRDGLAWQRSLPREPIIVPGPHAYDTGCIMNVASMPVVVGDEVWYYYTALSTTHGGTLPAKVASIALAKWRLDGFASLDAGASQGIVETKPLMTYGASLEINANASGGHISVEVLDEAGRPIKGLEANAFEKLSTDDVHHIARWKSDAKLPSGRVIRLRFILQDASLFSFTVRN